MNPYAWYKKHKLENQPSMQRCSIGFKIVLPFIGFVALIWFLIRVIPKPSRAAYPCQRIAFPLASSFVIWLMGIRGSLSFFKRATLKLKQKQMFAALFCLAVSSLIIWICLTATYPKETFASDPSANQPQGTAKGIHPGRVVWVHDPNATNWDGPGDGYSWQSQHTVQKYVDAMVSRSIRELTGQQRDEDAWNSLFVYFNNCHGKGQVGYTAGEKITIKVNLSTCNVRLNSVNPTTYDKINYLTKSDTSPQVITAILRQLVYRAGITPSDISVGDTVTYFPNQWWNICHSEFPEVTYFDEIGQQGRAKNLPSLIRQYWSNRLDPGSFLPDYIPSLYAQADYLINIAVLKGHAAGITLSAKNHYGSYIRTPDAAGYYSLHDSLASFNMSDAQYRALVDIMGHPHMGGKTVLYLVDGLYGGYYWQGTPYKFQMSPFNNDWPSSIFASQDPVAIDSVGLDILWQEWPHVVRVGGVDDYLKEAAQAEDPLSGTFYDPDGDGIALESLGVHERWNNPVDRQYSRNLGIGSGIELRYFKLLHYPGDLNFDERVDIWDLSAIIDKWLWTGDQGMVVEDINEDGHIDYADFKTISENWTSSL